MFQRLTRALVVAALAYTIGLHWAFFQSLAWIGMVVTYSQDASVTEALAKTFDGKHPCALCKQIAKGKQSERKSETPTSERKLEFSFARAAFIFCQPTEFCEVGIENFSAESLTYCPPVPPPKSSLA